MEAVDDGRRLIEIGERALELGKPILAWKIGNTEVGSRAAISHSARMTSGYGLYRAAFKQSGVVEIREVDELVDIAKVFLVRKPPAGNRVGVLTLSGGAGVLLADRCIEHGLALPPLSEATTQNLRKTLVSFASSNNPVDVTAHAYKDNYASYGEAIRQVLADPSIDQVVARVPRGRAAKAWAENLVEMLRDVHMPVILNWPSAPDDNGDVLAYLEGNGVPCMLGAGRSARALEALTDFARRRRASSNTASAVQARGRQQPLDANRRANTGRAPQQAAPEALWRAGSQRSIPDAFRAGEARIGTGCIPGRRQN
jgi:acyl-CoA synthetase (NDP forming)